MKAKIWNVRYWTSATDERMLDHELGQALEKSKFKILGAIDNQFKPFGYTKIWLLGESHLAVHTFPEEGKSYVELSSCIKSKFDNFIKEIYRSEIIKPEAPAIEITSEV